MAMETPGCEAWVEFGRFDVRTGLGRQSALSNPKLNRFKALFND